jgi:Na+-driven multidrug efflux pump
VSDPLASLGVSRARAAEILSLAAPTVAATLALTATLAVDLTTAGDLEPDVTTSGSFVFALALVWGVAAVTSALGAGVQVVAARRVGEGDDAAAGRVLANALATALAVGSIAAAGAWALAPAAAWPDPDARPLGLAFLRARAWGLPGFALLVAYRGFFDGVGRARAFLWAALACALTHGGLAAALSAGVGPLAGGGVAGLGVAGVAGVYVGLGVMIAFSLTPRSRVFRIYQTSNLSARACAELVRFSAPGGVGAIAGLVAVAVALGVAATLDARAAAQVARTLSGEGVDVIRGVDVALRDSGGLGLVAVALDWSSALAAARPPLYVGATALIAGVLAIMSSACAAFGGVASTLVSRSLGRADYAEAAAYGWDASKLAMCAWGAAGVALVLGAEAGLMRLSGDPLVVVAATPGLSLMAGAAMFAALALVLARALLGAGEVAWLAAVAGVVCAVFASSAYLFALVLGFGFQGVWFSGTLSVFLLAALVAVKFKAGSWTEIKV